MKFYALKHPVKGYLTSNKWWSGSWSQDINKAKKWIYLSHPKNVIAQTTTEHKKECQVVEIEFTCEPKITLL